MEVSRGKARQGNKSFIIKGRGSSVVEQPIRNRQVASSTLALGSKYHALESAGRCRLVSSPVEKWCKVGASSRNSGHLISKKRKPNPYCPVPGCRATAAHIDDPIVKALMAEFGPPDKMTAWTLAAMTELRESICRDLVNKKV